MYVCVCVYVASQSWDRRARGLACGGGQGCERGTPDQTSDEDGVPHGRARGRGGRGRSRGGRGRSRGGRGRGRGRGQGGSRDSRGHGVDPDSNWSSEPSAVDVMPFINEVGPSVPLSSPTETFVTLFIPELLQVIVSETNRYAKQCLSVAHQHNEGPPPVWETNIHEMKAVFGFMLVMGLNELPDLRDYWSNSEYTHYFPVASRITRHRFLEIMSYLHFVDNDTLVPRGQPGFDRLGKVRPVIEALRESFLSSYKPHKEASIDEAMIKFKGRSSLKQYLPKKPTKRGFKVWVRADSQNGFVSDLNVYTGKQEAVEANLGATVVKKLSRSLVGGRYHIYFDNYFASVSLLEDLLSDGLYACCTYRKDRKGLPKAVVNTTIGMFTHSMQHNIALYRAHCV